MKKNLGFTLMELLVVISIIGILMTLGLVSYTTAQKKGRDAKRKGDIKAMQNALEQYYSLNSSYGTTDTTCATQIKSGGGMTNLPTDPKNQGVDYEYQYSCPDTGASFCICAYVESDAGNTTCGPTAPTGRTGVYCMTNQQ